MVWPSFVIRILSVFVNSQVNFLHCFVYQFVEFVGRVFDPYVEIVCSKEGVHLFRIFV